MKGKIFLAIQVIILTVASIIMNSCSLGPVRIEGGLVSGVKKDGIIAYKGIPFAAPPVGDLRWKAPQPVKSWEGVLKAKEFATI